MPPRRLFNRRVHLATYLEREEAEAFQEACRKLGKSAAEVLRSFVKAFLSGMKEVKLDGANVTIVAPVNVVSARAEAKAEARSEAKLFVYRKRLEPLLERARNLAERERRLVKEKFNGRYDHYRASLDYATQREFKEKLREKILKLVERYGEIPEDLKDEVEAALNLLKAT